MTIRVSRNLTNPPDGAAHQTNWPLGGSNHPHEILKFLEIHVGTSFFLTILTPERSIGLMSKVIQGQGEILGHPNDHVLIKCNQDDQRLICLKPSFYLTL